MRWCRRGEGRALKDPLPHALLQRAEQATDGRLLVRPPSTFPRTSNVAMTPPSLARYSPLLAPRHLHHQARPVRTRGELQSS